MTPDALIQELNSASDLLESALDRYTKASATILNHFEPSGSAAQDLLNTVLAEFSRAYGYESMLQQSIAYMCRIRNDSPSFVPISIIPPEVMSRIFWFSGRCCLTNSKAILGRKLQPENVLVYPEVALEVCHRWRQIALTSHDLWSHIDIDLTSGSGGRLFSRAASFAARSNRSLVDLHIRTGFYCPEDQRVSDLFNSIAPRARSFDFQCDGRPPLSAHALDLWAGLFSQAIPGTLRRLRLDAHPTRESFFLVANDSALVDPSLQLNGLSSQSIPLTRPLFEGIMSSITILHLDGMYPYWTSRAYAGLIELDLNTSQKNMAISEFNLAGVLQASPGLRVLRFSLSIIFASEDMPPPPDPVHLNHLEVLQLGGGYSDAQQAILRMIYPGKRPLQMVAEAVEHFEKSSPSPYWVQFSNFISRARITQLHIEGVARSKIFIEVSNLLFSLPLLQVLTLCGTILGQGCEEILGDYDAASFRLLLGECHHDRPWRNLQLVRLSRCRIYWSDFRHMFEIHPTQNLTLDQCQLVTTPPKRHLSPFSLRRRKEVALIDSVQNICPTVELKGTYCEFEELSEFKLKPAEPNEDTRYPTSSSSVFGFSAGVSAFGSAFGS